MLKETDKIKNTLKISVVIPMYNCEEFVSDLLKMFSDQSFKDFEVICVIDGATDGTEDAVRKYCETDNRFRYVVRENGGAGAARNTGIENANGKYIIFPDADDLYSEDYLLKLYNAAEAKSADIAVCSTITIDYRTGEKRNIDSFNKTKMLEGEIYYSKKTKRILQMIDIHISNKMILLDLIKDEKLRFSETPATNDLFFSKAIIACARSIVVVHDDMITIRRNMNANSISSNRDKYSHIALMEVQKLYRWMEDRGVLGTYISDYLFLFDVTANYEMKNGINPLFVNEMARVLNVDEPWNKMNSGQIKRILIRSLGEKGGEEIRVPERDASSDELEKLQRCNKIAGERNESKMCMQEMVKQASLEQFGRDLDDPDSEAPCKKGEILKSKTFDLSKPQKEKNNGGSNNNPEISVIIPMYNCADFVNEVLTMFSDQSFSDFEVICVIDGATDKTESIVKEFCESDRRFRYIVRENGGAGAARNTGLDMAKGRYILWADADDEYSQDYLKKLYETAVKFDAQIVVCLFKKIDYKTHMISTQGFKQKDYYSGIVYSHSGIDNLFVSFDSRIPNKLFNTAFVRKNGLRFSETRISNDTFFSYAGLSVADRISVVDDILLVFRLFFNPNSVTGCRHRYLHETVITLRQLYYWLKDKSLLEIHGDGFMKRTDDVLRINSTFQATPRFISEVAHMLNAEEPWDKMTSGEILAFLSRSLLAEDAIRKKSDISSSISPELLESDVELGYLFDQCKNRIHTAELLRKVSRDRYGRDFEEIDGFPYDKPLNDNYFVIDSEHLQDVHSGFYGFCFTSSGIYTRNSILPKECTDIEGAYIIVKRQGNFITIIQDQMGCYGLFLFRKDKYWAISNNFNYLVDFVKRRYKLEFNKDYADALLVQSVCISPYSETIIKEIEYIDRRAIVIIYVDKKELKWNLGCIEEKIVPSDTKEGLDILDEWFYKYSSLYKTVADLWPGEIVVNVSGGFDTRMVLASLLGAKIDMERFSFYSKEKREEDFKIAKEISTAFGFELNKRRYPNTIIREKPEDRLIGRLTAVCFHKANEGCSTVSSVPRLLFGGSGGEMVRGYGFNKSKEQYIKGNTVRKSWKIKTDKKEKMVSSVSSFLDRGFERIKKIYPDKKDIDEQLFYSETRRRIHYGMEKSEQIRRDHYKISPMMDKIILKINEADNHCNDPNLIPAIIYTRYCPKLIEFEIEGGRSIAPETIAYAQKLNQMYPLAEKPRSEKADHQMQLFGFTPNDYSDKEISDTFDLDNAETESFIRRAFLSETVKRLFCLYYDEQLYDEIKNNEPDRLPRNNFENWEACVAIAKIIADTKPEICGRKYKNIAEFVLVCAEEVPLDEYMKYKNKLEEWEKKK